MAKYDYLCQPCALERKGEAGEAPIASDSIQAGRKYVPGGLDSVTSTVKYDGELWHRVNFSPSKARKCGDCGEKKTVLLRKPIDGEIEVEDNIYFNDSEKAQLENSSTENSDEEGGKE